MSTAAGQAEGTGTTQSRGGEFVWYELRTTDVDGAEAFYTHLAGWEAKGAGDPGGVPYRLLEVGGVGVAGLMGISPEMRACGVRAGWAGFISVEDVDRSAQRVEAAGGRLVVAPREIPGVGRFAAAEDPQGAAFLLFRGSPGAVRAEPPVGVPGTIGWVELSADDEGAAWRFYAEVFGWKEDSVLDMGAMGPYRMFGNGGAAMGAVMNRDRSHAAFPFWRYYINVADIDAAAVKIREKGGRIDAGPHPVPGDLWVVMGTDPQGVTFSIAGPRKQ